MKGVIFSDDMEIKLRFYWDVYFILNMIMNLFLSGMTAVVRRKIVHIRRILAASAAESGCMTAVTGAWLYGMRRGAGYGGAIKNIASLLLPAVALIAAYFMLWFSFQEHDARERGRNLLVFTGLSLLTGGAVLVLEGWAGKLELPGLWLVTAGAGGVFLVLVIVWRSMISAEGQEHVLDGTVYAGDGREYPLRILIDTGNQLTSPYSGERVMILSERAADQLQLATSQNPLWIPYRSIGGKGLLPAYRIPVLKLQDGTVLKHSLAAVSPNVPEDRGIQMIIPRL